MVAHCCDGLTACNDPVDDAIDADAGGGRKGGGGRGSLEEEALFR